MAWTVTPLPPEAKAVVLAGTLRDLEPIVDNGRLAVSFVRDAFNKRVSRHMRFSETKQSKAFGMFMRSCELEVSNSVHDANGQRGVKCLLYDEKVLNLLDVLGAKDSSAPEDSEHEKPCSASSA
jgi:hypothetical protein